MLYAMRENEVPAKIHVVDTDKQESLCGKSDRHMSATGGRDVTCPECQALAFHHEHKATVTINAKSHTLGGPRAYYAVIVSRAFDVSDIDDDAVYTVTYCNGPAANREGTMDGCHSVEIQDGMVFSVTDTGRA